MGSGNGEETAGTEFVINGLHPAQRWAAKENWRN